MRVVVDTNTLLSGLFFPGNERELVISAIHGRVRLLLPEDGSDELFRVIEESFRDSPLLDEGLRLLVRLLRVMEQVPRETYAERVPRWVARMRDPADAFIFACAEALHADGIVSGDRDVLAVQDREGVQVFRTRQLLNELRRSER